jgi:hypothetical protein
MAHQRHITRRNARRSLAVAWPSAHFHLRCATVKTSHTPGTLCGHSPFFGTKIISGANGIISKILMNLN